MLDGMRSLFSNQGFMPHVHCYLANPALVWTMFATDLMIGAAYFGISLTLYELVRRIRIPFSAVALCFGVFIAACGGTHFMEIYTLWIPSYWTAAGVKVVTAIASVGTGIYLYRLRHSVVTVAEAAKLAEQRRLDLETLTKDLEQRVEERTQALQEAVRVRDEFLSVASHELRTPLTSLLMQLQLARRSYQRNGAGALQAQEVLVQYGKSEQQLKRLARLVDDMLDISRISTGKLSMEVQTVNLAELVQEVAERMTLQLKQARCELRMAVGGDIVGEWDRFRLEQVLTNLLSNAAKYGAGAPVEVTASTDGSIAELRVIDHGRGISPGDQDRIFQRFERAVSPSEVSGLGLGLYIARQIVERLGGSIRVESELNHGASFIVSLPLKRASS